MGRGRKAKPGVWVERDGALETALGTCSALAERLYWRMRLYWAWDGPGPMRGVVGRPGGPYQGFDVWDERRICDEMNRTVLEPKRRTRYSHVREALDQLIQQGLVVLRDGAGWIGIALPDGTLEGTAGLSPTMHTPVEDLQALTCNKPAPEGGELSPTMHMPVEDLQALTCDKPAPGQVNGTMHTPVEDLQALTCDKPEHDAGGSSEGMGTMHMPSVDNKGLSYDKRNGEGVKALCTTIHRPTVANKGLSVDKADGPLARARLDLDIGSYIGERDRIDPHIDIDTLDLEAPTPCGVCPPPRGVGLSQGPRPSANGQGQGQGAGQHVGSSDAGVPPADASARASTPSTAMGKANGQGAGGRVGLSPRGGGHTPQGVGAVLAGMAPGGLEGLTPQEAHELVQRLVAAHEQARPSADGPNAFRSTYQLIVDGFAQQPAHARVLREAVSRFEGSVQTKRDIKSPLHWFRSIVRKRLAYYGIPEHEVNLKP